MPLWNAPEVTQAEVDAALALKANLASPALTGTPTVPTAAPGTNTDQIATTAFVEAAVSSGATPAPLVVLLPVAPGSAGAVYVPATATGTITAILAATSGGDGPGSTVVFTPAIGPSGGPFVPITDGSFGIPTDSPAGTMVPATPTAANATTLGTSVIEIAWTADGQSSAVYVYATLFFTGP